MLSDFKGSRRVIWTKKAVTEESSYTQTVIMKKTNYDFDTNVITYSHELGIVI